MFLAHLVPRLHVVSALAGADAPVVVVAAVVVAAANLSYSEIFISQKEPV